MSWAMICSLFKENIWGQRNSRAGLRGKINSISTTEKAPIVPCVLTDFSHFCTLCPTTRPTFIFFHIVMRHFCSHYLLWLKVLCRNKTGWGSKKVCNSNPFFSKCFFMKKNSTQLALLRFQSSALNASKHPEDRRNLGVGRSKAGLWI